MCQAMLELGTPDNHLGIGMEKLSSTVTDHATVMFILVVISMYVSTKQANMYFVHIRFERQKITKSHLFLTKLMIVD
jgi:hypothetical protein